MMMAPASRGILLCSRMAMFTSRRYSGGTGCRTAQRDFFDAAHPVLPIVF